MTSEVILETAILESLWSGGSGSEWLERVASGQVSAAVSVASLAELIRRVPDRRSEIRLMALSSIVELVDVTADTARRAGWIAREIDSDDPSAMVSAIVAATALENEKPVACVDDDFFAAMGCEIGNLDSKD